MKAYGKKAKLREKLKKDIARQSLGKKMEAGIISKYMLKIFKEGSPHITVR